MQTVQQNGRLTLFSSKFHYNISSIRFDWEACDNYAFNQTFLISRKIPFLKLERLKMGFVFFIHR